MDSQATYKDPSKPNHLVLVKHEQKWIFKYMSGEEQAVLFWLAEQARNPKSEFDWFDAAVLSHQMGDTLHNELKHLMNEQEKVDYHAA